MCDEIIMRNKIKKELIRRFNMSTAKGMAIVITMKVDHAQLIIVPDWCVSRDKTIEGADAFTVYVDLAKGRAALPYMSALSIDELASNIMNYSGIDVTSSDERFIYYMSQAEDYVAEYDMYEQNYEYAVNYLNRAG